MAVTIANVIVGVAELLVGPADGTVADVPVGYTEDGVTFEYGADVADIETEEETFPIKRVITKETITVVCNCAESSIANIGYAIAGADGHVNPVVIGDTATGGTIQTCAIKIVGKDPDGDDRTIDIRYAHPTGAVGMSYKKGEKTIVPMSLVAFKGDTAVDVCTITDS